jgi:mono/diheme cytochrome c family protein
MRSNAGLSLLLASLAASHATTVVAQQPQTPAPGDQCCVMGRGSMGRGMMGAGQNSMSRHHMMMMPDVPAPYRTLANPLPRTSATLDRGADVYARHCAACHGTTGRGDGEAGRGLSPPPTNLVWLSQMPMSGRLDPLMYWRIAEGGAARGTAMPAFKATLSPDDIWSVIAFVQARLPQRSKRP